MRRTLAVAVLAALALAAPAAARTPAHALRAGVARADITPPQTGYYLGGWTRADRVALGQSTRIYAHALVLQRGTTKVALVAAELFAVPAGLQADVARKVADLGYTRATVLLAASHTHSAPGGFANDPLYNTAAPSINTITDPLSFYRLLNPDPADRQLYTFLVDQIAAAVRRADADRAMAAAAWGRSTLTGVTQNRSLAAHLRDHGIVVGEDQARPSMDPDGPDHTIDPEVDVLRVDKLVRIHGRLHRMPIGAYANFADHGTVVHAETEAYSGDHHATAWRDLADMIRKAGHVPRLENVDVVYPNGAEGDQTAGIVHVGPAAAVWVGSKEAEAMFAAWRDAGAHLSRTPTLDLRWTVSCYCGRETKTGPVAGPKPMIGVPFLTGSEEGRGPLYDVTHVSLEGTKSPTSDPVQGDKVGVQVNPPPAVPFAVVRVGDGVLAAVPGEPTKEEGVRIRASVLGAMAGSGVTHVVIAGLADDYMSYVTTREEYGEQSYEGGSTLYGQNEGEFVVERLAELGAALAAGRPAPAPYDFDPSYGVEPDGPPYPAGAASGTITAQPPATVARLGMATLAWTGGPDGHDRPVDKAFVLAQRIVGRRWRTVDTDLGVAMLWRVDDHGHYTLEWQPAATVPTGTYRFVVTATRYALTSRTFVVTPTASLRVVGAAGRGRLRLSYPRARVDVDLIPPHPDVVVARPRRGPPRDPWGNTAG
jgi:hypothetical protein